MLQKWKGLNEELNFKNVGWNIFILNYYLNYLIKFNPESCFA